MNFLTMHSRTSSATSYPGSRGSEDSAIEMPQTSTLQKPPRIILDSSCPLLLNQNRTTLPALLQHLSTLPIPISGFDTSPSVPRGRPGESETLFGSTGVAQLGYSLDTKVAIMGSSLGPGKGELKAPRVRESLRGSLTRLRSRRIRTLYAQRPDMEVCFGELAGGFSGLVSEGTCERWGVQNFPTDTLRDLLKTCERRKYRKPAVYQGEYNILSNGKNDKIFNMIRPHGMVFYASSPTADGLLTDRAANGTTDPESPASNHSPNGTAWRIAYDTPEMRDVLAKITTEGKKHGISPLGAGLRWLAFHSQLDEADGIILNASSVEDLERRVGEIAKGPLPEEMVKLIEQVGIKVRDGKSRAS